MTTKAEQRIAKAAREAGFTVGGEDDPERVTAPSTRRVVCYNRACPDYRVERPAETACGCKRTSAR